ncbi:P-selectin glycoprotein ligand 1 [Struthio camelus]|uniref:P-selectin glycoprotein ligand 1 n=1 Tax=Struthio camelus TaxID=8801 RepID=UPI003603EA66
MTLAGRLPSRAGPMAPRGAVLLPLLLPLLLLPPLLLGALRARGAGPPLPGRGEPAGPLWLWATAAEQEGDHKLPPLARRKRDDGGWPPNATDVMAGYHSSTVAVAARGRSDSPEAAWLPSSAVPSTNGSLPPAFAALSTTADPLDETDPPDADLLPSSAAPSTNGSLPPAFAALSTTADPLDETDPPDADLLPSSAAPSTNGSGQRERSSPAPGSAGTGAYGKPGAPAAPTGPGQRDAAEAGETPWEGGTDVLMGKCLLAICILALVAATFIVCTAALGTLLWRQRQRAAGRRLSRTEMVCISSLLPDGEPAANGARPGPAKRPKALPETGSEAEGDNLTLSSFLPEHA